MNEFYSVKVADRVGLRVHIIIAVIYFFYTICTEHLSATAAGFRCTGDELDVSASEKGTKVDLSMKHEFTSSVTIEPKFMVRIKAGRKPVVCGADDSIVEIKGNSAYLTKRVFGP